VAKRLLPDRPTVNRQTGERPRNIGELRQQWVALSIYQRFETVVGIVLTLVIGAVIAVALYRLIVGVIELFVLESVNPLDHEVFQAVFGQIMTLLIALEFNHTLHHAVTGDRGIIHTRTVILIAVLALARKIIVSDLFEAPPVATVALATLMLALGVTYWLIRNPDDRLTAAEPDA
jgi:uncharacterized membrane protein (DUF373 family)